MKWLTRLKRIVRRKEQNMPTTTPISNKLHSKIPFGDMTAKQFWRYYKAMGGIRFNKLGDIICPHCGTHFITEGKFVVSGSDVCPRCHKEWLILPEVADMINEINASRDKKGARASLAN